MGDSGTVLSEEQKALTIRILEEARGNLYLELHDLKGEQNICRLELEQKLFALNELQREVNEARASTDMRHQLITEKEARVAEIEGIIGAFGSPLEQITLVTPNVSEFDSKSSFDV